MRMHKIALFQHSISSSVYVHIRTLEKCKSATVPCDMWKSNGTDYAEDRITTPVHTSQFNTA